VAGFALNQVLLYIGQKQFSKEVTFMMVIFKESLFDMITYLAVIIVLMVPLFNNDIS